MKQAARALWRNPILTVTIGLSLAVCIAGNSAIFTIVNALFLHPPGIRDAATVVAPRVTYKKLHLDGIEVSVPDYAVVQSDSKIFAAAALANDAAYTYTGGVTPERLQGQAITSRWFDVLGAKPVLGRMFTAEEDQTGANHVIVLSHALWGHLFGEQSSALGKVVELDRQPYRVVGVMPAESTWPRSAQFWVPLALTRKAFTPQEHFNESYTAIARLQPNVTLAQAEREMRVLSARVHASNPAIGAYIDASEWSLQVEPYTQLIAGNLKTPVVVLFASIALVLIVACSNMAGLLLLRGNARGREFAVRRALGAQAGDILRHSIAEVCLLCLAGTALGVLLTPLFLKAVLFAAPKQLTQGLLITSDNHVLLFTIVLGAIVALALALLPALHLSRSDVSYSSLKEGGRSGTLSAPRQRTRGALVVGQIALALVLLVGTSFLLKTLTGLRSHNLGFNPVHVLSGSVELPASSYPNDVKRIELFRSVERELAATPGVISASSTRILPFDGQHWTATFSIEGRPDRQGDPGPHSYQSFIGPKYFDTLQIPILRGRAFTDSDRQGSAPVAIVDANLARTYWPGQDPVGKRLRSSNTDPWVTIIGVSAHAETYTFAASETRGILYRPVYQVPFSSMSFIVRTQSDSSQMVERAIHRADPTLATFDFSPLSERIGAALAPEQFAVDLLIGFAFIAMALTAMGLYGVISFSALGRTKEIGIRSALGASRSQILGTLTSQGARLIAVGLVVGAILSLVFVRVLSTRVESLDISLGTAVLDAIALTMIGGLATLLPAWRASRSNAASILRNE